MPAQKNLLLQPLSDYEPTIGAWLWAFQDTRRRTLDSLEGIDDDTVNWSSPGGSNSIGSLLYHIAAIEISWLHEDILEGAAFTPEIDKLMIYNVREEDGALTTVTTEPLKSHLNRLAICRQHFLSKFTGMSLQEFRRPRKLDQYNVTPEWVIHHLIQHEAEHRGQIGELRKIAEKALNKS